MPQLDITFYFPQLLSTFIIFFLFYYFILKYLLPQISKVLKLRKKIINKNKYKYSNVSIILQILFFLENKIFTIILKNLILILVNIDLNFNKYNFNKIINKFNKKVNFASKFYITRVVKINNIQNKFLK